MKTIYNIAYCGLGWFKNIIGDHCHVYTDSHEDGLAVHIVFCDSLHYRGWKSADMTEEDNQNVGETVEVVKKFTRNGEIRYVCLWESFQ